MPRRGLIINGAEAPVGAYPFAVSLQRLSSHTCGGSSIDREWVMTAAHCVVQDSGATHPASSLSLLLGAHSLSGNEPPNACRRRMAVAEVVVHPDYRAARLENDIALLKLAAPVSRACFDPTVRLDGSRGSPSLARDGVEATVAGWGRTKAGGSAWAYRPDKLQEVDLPVVGKNNCQNKHGHTMPDGMLCAGGDRRREPQRAAESRREDLPLCRAATPAPPGCPCLALHGCAARAASRRKDTCRGDSGSALFLEGEGGTTLLGARTAPHRTAPRAPHRTARTAIRAAARCLPPPPSPPASSRRLPPPPPSPTTPSPSDPPATATATAGVTSWGRGCSSGYPGAYSSSTR